MNKILIIVVSFLVLLSDMAFAGGGGGKGGGGSSGPRYYSFEDLRSEIRNQTFYFENSNKPANALASLGYFLSYPACASKNAKLAGVMRQDPSKFQINNMKTSSNWNDRVEIPVKWDDIRLYCGKGDLIFTRGNGKGPDFVKFFSNWTHIAMVYDPWNGDVFESTPENNVGVSNAKTKWSHTTYYTCKMIETIPYSYRIYLLDNANAAYTGIRYFPKVETAIDRLTFAYKWSDKDDMNSMYCSKLVYQTFKPYIDMDSGRTSVTNPRLQKAVGSFMFSWVGVSPDEIYFSPALGPDFAYSDNIWSL